MQEKLEKVRLQIGQWVQTHACQAASKPWRESILLKDGCLHGYRFCIGSVEAVWIIDQWSIEIRRDGRLADTLNIPSDVTRRAA